MLRNGSKAVVIKIQHENISTIMHRDLLNLDRIVRCAESKSHGPRV